MATTRRGTWAVVLVLLGAAGGCKRGGESSEASSGRVVVYCSVDAEFARAVFDRYRAETGVELAAVTDSEAGKTTGLVNRIISEAMAGRPRADVLWSSELFNTILLSRKGLLEPYESPAAVDIPARFKDPENRWTALAVRGRVIAFNPDKTDGTALPGRWSDLAKPEFAGQLAFANPLFGTTRGHLAAMFALWGEEKGRAFLTGLRDGGVLITDGNSSAVRALIAERARIAATDTDDVWVAQRGGASLDLRYLDLGDGGTLLIPCSVALIAGGPNPQASRKLVDFLVSAEVERMLAKSASRNIPVREALRKELGIHWPKETKITFDAVADAMEEAVAAAREILLR